MRVAPADPDNEGRGRRRGGRVEFATTDPDRAQAYLSTAYGNLTIRSGRDNYRFRHVRIGTGPFHLDYIDHSATGQVRCDPLPVVTVMRVHRGARINVDTGEESTTGDITIGSQAGQPASILHESARYTATVVPIETLVETARNRPDDPLPPLRFTCMQPANPACARRWLRTVDYVTDNLRTSPDAMAQPLLAGATARLLAATLLTTFPNTLTTEPQYFDRTDATPTTLTRATTFIDANADLDITIGDIARASNVTVRAVQLAFRRHLDTTPMAYLRLVRLTRAHEQLRAANPSDGTTVTEVAIRWGYASPSRFTSHYRQTYGRLPSHTLRD